jgi:hypothetical protein
MAWLTVASNRVIIRLIHLYSRNGHISIRTGHVIDSNFRKSDDRHERRKHHDPIFQPMIEKQERLVKWARSSDPKMTPWYLSLMFSME